MAYFLEKKTKKNSVCVSKHFNKSTVVFMYGNKVQLFSAIVPKEKSYSMLEFGVNVCLQFYSHRF